MKVSSNSYYVDQNLLHIDVFFFCFLLMLPNYLLDKLSFHKEAILECGFKKCVSLFKTPSLVILCGK